jgi:urease accessory protein
MKLITAASTGLLAGFSQLAVAHPGHGAGHGHDVLHPFLGAEHVLLLAAIGLVAWYLRGRAGSDRHDEE